MAESERRTWPKLCSIYPILQLNLLHNIYTLKNFIYKNLFKTIKKMYL
jgi:hypothetical protein